MLGHRLAPHGRAAGTTELEGIEGWLRFRLGRLHELGLRETLRRVARHALAAVHREAAGLIFTAEARDVRSIAPRLQPGESYRVVKDETSWLVSPPSGSWEAAREAAFALRCARGARRERRTIHVALVNDKAACWGWSYWPELPIAITEVGTTRQFPPGSVSLYGFFTVPEMRNRGLYAALLGRILRERFAEGARRAFIMCLETNVASHRAIERVGFRLMEIHRSRRWLWWNSIDVAGI
jgi:RimJ/RimL family protein N-acetyltransferase